MRLRLKKRLRFLQRRLELLLARKISNRLILTNVALGSLPVVLIGLLLTTLTSQTVQSYIHERNLETARRAGNDIALFLQEPLTILKTVALTRDMVSMQPLNQSNLINRIKRDNQLFQKLFVLDDSGRVLVTTRFGEEASNLSAEPFFAEVMAGRSWYSDVYFTGSRFPVMLLAEPVLRYNEVVGILAGEVDLENIWAVVDSIRIGTTGLAFLLSEKGQVIAHPDKSKVLERQNYSSYAFFDDLSQGRRGVTTFEIAGKKQVLAYMPLRRPPWGVVVQQTEAEAFTLASQMQRQVIYALLLTTLIAVLLGVLGVKRFTRPLLELVKGVREYAEGNLEHKIEMRSRDEIATLAQEFNSMAGSLKKNQQELSRMERLAALSRFAALVSHEVRNPLNSMNINMQILKRIIYKPEVETERKVKYLDVISSEITRINDLVTNFLTIARPPELRLSLTPVHQVLDEVLLLQEARAEAEGVLLKKQYCDGNPVGMLDYNQLKQVFLNVIINSLEAMKDSGTIRVETTIIYKGDSAESSGDRIQIRFQDDGEGIPEDILTEVFEFYYTTKRAGSGIGLAIAKQIVEGHNGSVYIESREQEGTLVVIDLPIEPAESGQA